MYLEDTIVALATPPGPGGIGVVRVSGPDAERIAGEVFQGRSAPAEWPSHHMQRGRLVAADGRPIDDALAVLMRSPRSYTGEDVLEIHCHGSPVVLRRAVDVIVRAGARAAAPGEFTKRAFLNGKIDLTQAEAVCDLVGARTRAGATMALEQLSGGLSRRLEKIRERVIRIKAHLEVQLDFSDEDVGIDPSLPSREVAAARAEVAELLNGYEHARLLREGVRVAIVGPPNAGKSTLLNALVGEERAIVTAIPGTTRDVIEECADFAGVPVILSDTAGLREATDEVERIGVERAVGIARGADLVLHVLDAALPPTDPWPDLDGAHVLMVLNKSDLPCAWTDEEIARLSRRHSVVRVSAKQRRGLDELRAAVTDRFGASPAEDQPVLTRQRQAQAMESCLDCIERAAQGLETGVTPDLVAVDIQNALDAIGSVTGAITSEDVLDCIFGQFCIGK